MKTLIIGSGRLATHIRHFFDLRKIPFETWSRGENTADELTSLTEWAERIWILISDSSLHGFVRDHLNTSSAIKLHASGALEIPDCIGLHPLMTFAREPYDLSTYNAIQFAVPVSTTLQDFFPELENQSFALSSSHRALYHALCASIGNLPSLIWREALPQLRALGVPPEAVNVYLKQVLVNSIQDPVHAPTGPIVRNDRETIAKHLSVLPRELADIYMAFLPKHKEAHHATHPGI